MQLNSFSFFVLIFMFLQNSRIRGFRVALRAAEWFFISVHVSPAAGIFSYETEFQKRSRKAQLEHTAMKKGREEELLYNSSHVTFASHTFDN